MAANPTSAATADDAAPTRSVLLYDGDCGFCTRSAAFLAARLNPPARVTPWQAVDLGPLGLNEAALADAAYWVDDDGAVHRGHAAIAAALANSRRPWSIVGHLLRVPPLRWVAAPTYRIVARNRHRMPGSADACRVDP